MGESSLTIAVPLGPDPAAARELVAVAAALVPPGPSGAGRVIAIETVPGRPSSLSQDTGAAKRQHAEPGPRPRIEVRAAAATGAAGWPGVVAVARECSADLLLVDWRAWADASQSLFGSPLHEAITIAPCDLAAVRLGRLTRVRQVLLPVRGGPQGLPTLRLAMGLAERHDATITLLHVEQPGLLPDNDAEVRAQLDALLARGAHPARAQPAIVIAGSVEAAIAVEAEAHQVTIMGASPGDPGTPLLLGPVAEAVAAQVTGTLIIVKARE